MQADEIMLKKLLDTYARLVEVLVSDEELNRLCKTYKLVDA